MTRHGYDEVVLLTGFPSFAAKKMCFELVRADPRTWVYAVVDKAFAEEARSALEALEPRARARVELLEGDASAMDFGLSGAELASLAPEIDRIHHMAVVPSLGADRKLAERVVLGGARELLEVARACRSLKCAVYHSSAHVSGDRVGLVLEGDLDEGQSFRNVVEETLARGEKMMRASMANLPVCVVRPTTVSCDSTTFDVGREGGTSFLVLLLMTSPHDFPLLFPGRPGMSLHVVPVDYYVRAASALGKDARAVGRTFHIGDPQPLTATRVFELVGSASRLRAPRGFLPANLAKALMRTPGYDRFAKSPRAFLDALAAPVSYSFANTTELLADTPIRCPTFESYVEGLVEHLQGRVPEEIPHLP